MLSTLEISFSGISILTLIPDNNQTLSQDHLNLSQRGAERVGNGIVLRATSACHLWFPVYPYSKKGNQDSWAQASGLGEKKDGISEILKAGLSS